jgi:hypothetical protein
MSTEYYVRLERGNATGVSESILDGISRALQLDAAEHKHLCHLVRTANEGAHTRRQRKSTRQQQVRPGVQQTIDAMTSLPVIVQNGRLDVVAANRLGLALFAPMFETYERSGNFARFLFLDPRAVASIVIGVTRPSNLSRCCAVRPGVLPMIAPSPTWSANCPRAATNSGPYGPPTMSVITRRATNVSTTPSSVTSTSPTKPWK